MLWLLCWQTKRDINLLLLELIIKLPPVKRIEYIGRVAINIITAANNTSYLTVIGVYGRPIMVECTPITVR